MAHLTKKKIAEREKNNRLRGMNEFNTGTRDMGYESNNARKAALHMQLAKLAMREAV